MYAFNTLSLASLPTQIRYNFIQWYTLVRAQTHFCRCMFLSLFLMCYLCWWYFMHYRTSIVALHWSQLVKTITFKQPLSWYKRELISTTKRRLFIASIAFIIIMVEIFSQQGFSSLHFASQEGHTAVAQLLIESQAKLDIKNNVSVELLVHAWVWVASWHVTSTGL